MTGHGTASRLRWLRDFIPGGEHDRLVYHELAQTWPTPVGVTDEPYRKFQRFRAHGQLLAIGDDDLLIPSLP